MLQIAKILKSNGTEGGLLFSFRDIDPAELSTEEPVFIEFDGLPVPFFIQDIVLKGNDKAIIRLNDVRNLKDAEEFVGRAVFSDEFEEDDTEGEFSLLRGWKVEDVGTVLDFVDIPSNPCLDVALPDGRSVLVPIHDDLILSLDEKKKTLRLSIPEGLLNL